MMITYTSVTDAIDAARENHGEDIDPDTLWEIVHDALGMDRIADPKSYHRFDRHFISAEGL